MAAVLLAGGSSRTMLASARSLVSICTCVPLQDTTTRTKMSQSTNSGVAYGNDSYLLTQSTKFGTLMLRMKGKLWRGYQILDVKFKVRSCSNVKLR